jgi:DNA mismatch repair protein MutL
MARDRARRPAPRRRALRHEQDRYLEDLERAATLGFRGEALASIGAVARLAIVSRRAAERHAWRIACNAGEVSAVEPAALAAGTAIDVEELYFNTPADANS